MTSDPHTAQPPEGEHPMTRLLEQYLPERRLKAGQIVRGTVVRVDPGMIVVDVGAKCEGTITGRELERIAPEVLASLKPGDEVAVYILDPESECGEIALSFVRAQQEEGWLQAEALLRSQETIELEVIGSNRGGLIVRLGGTRGFVPASQLDLGRNIPRISDMNCSEALAGLVGCRMRLQVIEADRERSRLILSERAAISRQQIERANSLLESLREGERRKGRVSNLTNFGAFVDLGGLDGLLHLSEISWKSVSHPSEVLKVGQEIEVMVLGVDRERRQVALSLKRLQEDPWVGIDQRYQVGQTVTARVTRITKWGAFARLVDDEAIEGLIHVSELDEQHVVHPRDVVRPGQELTLRIVRIEPERHRLALSLKQVAAGEEAGSDWKSDYMAVEQPPPESPIATAFQEATQG
jgi:small subunit ribosomal protein S1